MDTLPPQALMDLLNWLGIAFCVSQSAMFSGLNLAFFSITKLRLEIESKKGNVAAIKIAGLRNNSNFLLTTILWGNVGINVLLTLLSNSVMTGFVAFIFSTFLITLLGEIAPQAYFSRHALKMASLLSPVLRFYQILLYPVAKPTAKLLDLWLGSEAIRFFREKDLRELLKIHVDAPGSDIEKVEGKGALNFLALDDLSILEVGVTLHPKSIIQVPFRDNKPVFQTINNTPDDPFLKKIQESCKKWVVFVDSHGRPKITLDADAYLRSVLFSEKIVNPLNFSHYPIVISDPNYPLDEAISQLKVYPKRIGDDVIDHDIILFWGDEQKRVITGSDVLGRLLRGIAQQEKTIYQKIKS